MMVDYSGVLSVDKMSELPAHGGYVQGIRTTCDDKSIGPSYVELLLPHRYGQTHRVTVTSPYDDLSGVAFTNDGKSLPGLSHISEEIVWQELGKVRFFQYDHNSATKSSSKLLAVEQVRLCCRWPAELLSVRCVQCFVLQSAFEMSDLPLMLFHCWQALCEAKFGIWSAGECVSPISFSTTTVSRLTSEADAIASCPTSYAPSRNLLVFFDHLNFDRLNRALFPLLFLFVVQVFPRGLRHGAVSAQTLANGFKLPLEWRQPVVRRYSRWNAKH